MKANTNFPYDVKVISANKLAIQELENDDDSFEYEIKVPDMVLHDSKYEHIKDKLKIVAEVNCSSTMWRQTFSSKNLNGISFSVPKKMVFKSFSISILILFDQDSIWDGKKLKKGMPIIYLGSFKVDLEPNKQGLLSFKPNNEDFISYSFSQDAINILIPNKKYDWLLKHKHDPTVKQILTSQIAQVALIEACNNLGDETLNHLKWQKELIRKWQEYKTDGSEVPKGEDVLNLVNYILKNPSDSLIDFLIQKEESNE